MAPMFLRGSSALGKISPLQKPRSRVSCLEKVSNAWALVGCWEQGAMGRAQQMGLVLPAEREVCKNNTSQRDRLGI